MSDGAGRVFLLSPADCRGVRARQVLAPRAASELARRLRSRDGAPLGDVFAFVSALYFRGKLAYARRFAHPPVSAGAAAASGVFIITPSAGLVPAETLVTRRTVRAFASSDVHATNSRYRRPLEQSAQTLARAIGPDCEVVLLGSIATKKYADVLLAVFGGQLRFPGAFVGRGDMSRGGLLLRHAAGGVELDYVCLDGAVTHGARPPKLPPLRGRT